MIDGAMTLGVRFLMCCVCTHARLAGSQVVDPCLVRCMWACHVAFQRGCQVAVDLVNGERGCQLGQLPLQH